MSTLMTPYDRDRVLNEIRNCLREGAPCRVVSTSLIEAGVDVDFPQVFRQLNGLESIIQSGGRCNREGKRDRELSRVRVFEFTGAKENLAISQNLYATRTVWKNFEEPDSLEAILQYFTTLYTLRAGSNKETFFDCVSAMEKGKDQDFSTLAKEFHLICSEQKIVYVEQKNQQGKTVNSDLLMSLKNKQVNRDIFRKLGRFSVQLYPNEYIALLKTRALDEVELGEERFGILWNESQYDKKEGVILDSSSLDDAIL